MGKRTASGGPGGEPGGLEALADAFEAGSFEEVVRLTDGLSGGGASGAERLHYRAAALAELERLEEAMQVYAAALEAAPDDLELLLSACDFLVCHLGEERDAMEQALALCTRGRKLAEREGDVEMLFELLLMEGTALNQLGECAQALRSLEGALGHVPRSVEALRERSVALFELCRFADAQAAFERVLQEAPQDAWAHHYLGLLAERRKDGREAARRFERAQALAPEDFPPPVHLDDAAFDAALEDAVRGLPEHVKKYLDNVTITVEAIPSDEDLLAEAPPLSPAILGVFRGVPVGERSVTNAFDHFPAAIVLYQRNLERFARTREELIEQIGITVMHEVGHLIGLDEEDLWKRGLD